MKINPLLVCALALPSIAFAQTTWTGATDSVFSTSTNWTAGTPDISGNDGFITGTGPAVSIDNSFSSNVTQTGNTVTWDVTAAKNFSGGVYNLNGGTFDLATSNIFILNGSTMNVDGGSFTASVGAGSIRFVGTAATLNIYSTVSMPLTTNNQRDGSMLIDGVTATFGTYLYALNGVVNPLLTIQNGGTLDVSLLQYGANPDTGYGQITMGSGVNSIVAANTTGRFTEFNFDFEADSVGSSITVAGASAPDEATWISQWAAGKLTVAGSNSGDFADYFTFSGDTLTLTSVPEPGMYALFLSLGILGCVIRRRQSKANRC
ncbi:PEP-CTERM sorting domain-containing protein [Cerasicoccus maritimus]|uniref:PEP-CTERM sorting domain-containing protein n=1 Tax=Cerasicoccus maritimus TaxID=490089 RepID=UPI0028529E0B|nr:PEP-CTERM sorting domain-containing protein [Cerasicoccus maritimus]